MRHLLTKWWRAILIVQDTPHRVAWGFAIGLFIGWLPIMGIQMPVAAFAAWRLRGNVLASLPPVWISNPITVLPIYYLCNRTGALIYGQAASWERISDLLQKMQAYDFKSVTGGLYEVVIATVVGGTLLGLATAIPGYFMVKMLVSNFQRVRMERRLRWLGIIEPPQPADVHPLSVEEATPAKPLPINRGTDD